MFVKIAAKTLIILAIISTGYYFFSRTEYKKLTDFSAHYANLVKNKLAYINLAKLDLKKPGFDSEKLNLIGIIQETNKIGLKKPLNDTEKDIFTRQEIILGKVFATKSYGEGVTVLKSKESVQLLTDETSLIENLFKQLKP